MSPQDLVASGWGGYLLILAAGVAMTEPWRWAGVWLSRDLDIDSAIFRWVRAVSTALVAGLVTRLLVFPTGQLEGVPLGVRLGAFAIGIVVFLALGRRLALGVISGAASLLLGAELFSS
ncbi:MAG: AzlD domain-containing protein [Pseudomonadota bacterium]